MIGSVSGMHTSPTRGSSVEFAEYRRYVPGDDIRRLDWRAYGRSDRFYVKEFEADTNLRLGLVVDTSGSMGFGFGNVTKLDFGRRLVGALASIAIRQGDAVGMTCVGESIVHQIPPRRTPSHLRTMFDLLEHTQATGATDLVGQLHTYAETTPARAMVAIVSDLFVDVGELKEALEHLKFRRHDVAIFHLLAPDELKLPIRKPTRFVDMETGAAVFADPAEILDRYQVALAEYLAAMKSMTLAVGVDYRMVSIDADYEAVLSHFLTSRLGRRGSR